MVIATAYTGEERRAPLAPLTGVRIFAAFAVLVYHFAMSQERLPALLQPAKFGFLGVNLFFVLSGFILVYNYLGRESRYSEFWWLRLIRIYPAYLLALLFALYTMPAATGNQFALEALLVQGWVPGYACGINCPDWSISCEALFYAVFPLLAAFAERFGLRILAIVAMIAWTVSMVVGGYVAFLEHLYGGKNVSGIFEFASYHPLLNANQFIVGMVAGVAFLRHRERVDARRRILGWGVVLSTLLILAWLEISPPVSQANLRLGLLSPYFAMLLLYLACTDGPTARFLSLSVVVLLGEASYSVYLLQTPMARLFHEIMPNMVGSALAFVALMTASVASFLWFERPVRKMLRKIPQQIRLHREVGRIRGRKAV